MSKDYFENVEDVLTPAKLTEAENTLMHADSASDLEKLSAIFTLGSVISAEVIIKASSLKPLAYTVSPTTAIGGLTASFANIIDKTENGTIEAADYLDFAGSLVATAATLSPYARGAALILTVSSMIISSNLIDMIGDAAEEIYEESKQFLSDLYSETSDVINEFETGLVDYIDNTSNWFELMISDYESEIIEFSHSVGESLTDLIDVDDFPSFSNAESITSPLVLDLDNDGIETTSLSDGVYFDHDNNGRAEKSGWVSSDDGLLVIDRNNDGLINNGSELFGNNTSLSSGGLADNGFQALDDFDSNQDGVIDQNDTAFNDLNIWRDFNQDGISQQHELFSLDDAGISSISTEWNETLQQDTSGNEIRQTGTATFSDGSNIDVADVWFNTNLSDSRDHQSLEVNASIQSLPNVRGFGNVSDLHQAMATDAALLELVQSFTASDDDAFRKGLLDQIIYQWTGVQDVDPYSRDPSKVYGHVMDARQLEALEELAGREYLGTWCWGERDPNPHGRAAPVLIEQFNEFRSFVHGQLMAGSHFSEYFDLIGIRFDLESFSFKPDLTVFTSVLEGLVAEGDQPLVSRVLGVMKQLSIYSSDLSASLTALQSNTTLGPLIANSLLEGSEAGDVLSGSASNDLIVGHEGDDVLMGNRGNDTYLFNPGDGSDRIYDSGGNDLISFGHGIEPSKLYLTRNVTSLFVTLLDDFGQPTGDRLQIDNVFDFDGSVKEGAIEAFHFADGTSWDYQQIAGNIIQEASDAADALYGTDLDDVLAGMAGNDELYGGAGDDVYRFQYGDGQDVIFENRGFDSIEFYGGIGPDNVVISRQGHEGENIVLSLLDNEGHETGDQITIIKAYENLIASGNQVEQVRFVDPEGQVESMSLYALSIKHQATTSDDVIYGFEGNDVINADDGNDIVHAAAGDDVIIGGRGNDFLQGGSGSDKYLFSAGSGHDVIDNNDKQVSSVDVIEFDDSINRKQVRLLRAGDDLLISIDRNKDSIQLKGYFEGDDVSLSAVDEIRFSDGAVLTVEDIRSLSLDATQGADYIEGFSSDDAISALAGDDIVYAGNGDDLVAGEQGADLIYGENGNDMLFGNQDRDQLYGGQGNDVLDGGKDSDQLYGSAGEDLLKGGDGNDYLDGGAQNDELLGNNGNDSIYGMRGNDLIAGGRGDDQLNGGFGDDLIKGDAGDDSYHYSLGDGEDVLIDSSGYDVLSLSGIDINQVWLTQQQDDLLIEFLGEQGELTIKDWNSSGDRAIDEIHLGEMALVNSQIDSLVQAMAAFDPEPASGTDQFTMPETLEPVLAASWQPSS